MSLKVHRNSTTLSCSLRIGAIFTKNHTGIPRIKVFSVPRHLCLFRPNALCKMKGIVLMRTALTVLLVHKNLKGVHFIILKCLPNLLTSLLVCELSVHEAEKNKAHRWQSCFGLKTLVPGWLKILAYCYTSTLCYSANHLYNIKCLCVIVQAHSLHFHCSIGKIYCNFLHITFSVKNKCSWLN